MGAAALPATPALTAQVDEAENEQAGQDDPGTT
jgi:hypothetical protein